MAIHEIMVSVLGDDASFGTYKSWASECKQGRKRLQGDSGRGEVLPPENTYSCYDD